MDKVRTQFEELKSQGKIVIAEKVKKSSKVDNFEAIKKSRTIKYNDGMIKLQDDDINFWLLHEEGHLFDPLKVTPIVYLVIIILISFFPLILVIFFPELLGSTINTNFLSIVSLCLFFPIFRPLACRWMKNIQQNREYDADDFACNKIDNTLRIESTFKRARFSSTNNKKWWQKILPFIICKKYSHPSDEDRIKRIKQNHSEIILLESEKEKIYEKNV